MNHLSETEFMAMFRMDRASFNELEVELENSLPSVNRNISIKTRVAVTLRWLAGGQYLDLCFTWGISKASFYSVDGVLWPTIIALDAILPSFGLPVHNADAMRALSDGFKKHSNGILDGCVLGNFRGYRLEWVYLRRYP
jgi:hypothetical protein